MASDERGPRESSTNSEAPPEEAAYADSEFEAAMADVTPLAQDRLAPEPIWRPVATIGQREQEVLRELDALVRGNVPIQLEETDELLRGAVPGLDPRVMRNLAKGEFTVQAEIDLHGCDSETARTRLEAFLVEAHRRGFRCVKVVHGRGRRSPNKIPVLKSQLPRWLSRGPARHVVLAYTSARPRDGGAGASYVLLRRGRQARTR